MKKKRPGTVRIIGGKWRGTRLPVPDLTGLRPSGDRSRETLFNWLQADIHGATCIDLFAGSGVLGLEAASRGAGQVTLIEKSRVAAAAIRESAQRLDAEQVQVVQTDAIEWLADCESQSMDIVFIDPPFCSSLERRVIELLSMGDCLNTGALIYLETAWETPPLVPPPAWEIIREKRLGEVRMQLLKKN
ncbi:MAG: 16S rRNA (guanine(966)-N(2))-methyltransferase RsmD [Xanthomonadales bacterium]|jgi:16S rRNA (guanine966-N2)-methyltransferase|nr:16S rRNA (guanine(966)-N(2))-methyltransferase RsmD [Xanthomonadales bacterium]MDH3924509.1 16S rRNA (guanine(966)-N(2))-methyltransferase RsmD [Xanthomonadales bacterium]MDH3942253.1 16S rRNA (guanine(966)-N(2))-methyltransferase RsmD [Xanthomonadales bacterium]MDH4000435.1 16S rRNA (guanine(966)-N(2))-methyltransferase RsmD [Xanthomonadales bacterium]